MSEQQAIPDFGGWSPTRMAAHLKHLDRLLGPAAFDPSDPLRPQLKAEREAALAALRATSGDKR